MGNHVKALAYVLEGFLRGVIPKVQLAVAPVCKIKLWLVGSLNSWSINIPVCKTGQGGQTMYRKTHFKEMRPTRTKPQGLT